MEPAIIADDNSPSHAYRPALGAESQIQRQSMTVKKTSGLLGASDSNSQVRRSTGLGSAAARHNASFYSKCSRESKSKSQRKENLVNMQQQAPYYTLKDISLRDTWTLGPLSKLSYEERNIIKQALAEEMKKYSEVASERHPDAKNSALLMMSGEEHCIRSEVMRRNVFQQLK